MIFGTPKDSSLKANSLSLNIVSATETCCKVASTICQKWFKAADCFIIVGSVIFAAFF